jgi:hypothetical protein
LLNANICFEFVVRAGNCFKPKRPASLFTHAARSLCLSKKIKHQNYSAIPITLTTSNESEMMSACCFFPSERSGVFTNFAPLLEVNKQNKSRPKTLSLDQIFVQRHTYELNPSSTEVLAFVIKLLPTNPKFSRCFERKSLVWDVELLRVKGCWPTLPFISFVN